MTIHTVNSRNEAIVAIGEFVSGSEDEGYKFKEYTVGDKNIIDLEIDEVVWLRFVVKN